MTQLLVNISEPTLITHKTIRLYTRTRIKGEKGDKGDAGPKGPQGERGLQGPKGDQGIQGPKGDDGTSSYTHIAYADSADGTVNFSTSNPDRDYIGMYVDSSPSDSTSPSRYNWTRTKGLKGDQGIPGNTGDDGKTSYLHIAYAMNADGSSGFSTSDSTGKTHIGQYTDYISADSSDPSDPSRYTWTKIKGEKGDTGSQGPKGERGPQGPNVVDGNTSFGNGFETVGNNGYATVSIPASSGSQWMRIARLAGGGRAHARFILRDTTSGHHGIAVFEAGVHYSKNPYINLTAYGQYSSTGFTNARIVYGDTYDDAYLEVYVTNDSSRTQTLSFWMTDNIQQPGWTGQNWIAGGMPSGFSTFSRGLTADDATQGTIDLWRAPNTLEIDGANLRAKTVTADSILVNDLSSISADLGTVTAGNLTTNTFIDVGTNLSVGDTIVMGSAGDTGTKDILFFYDEDARPEGSIGNVLYTYIHASRSSGGSESVEVAAKDGLDLWGGAKVRINGGQLVIGDIGGLNDLIVTSDTVNIDSPITGFSGGVNISGDLDTSGDLYFNNNAIVSAGSGTNTDHIWHDDGENAWHLVSDGSYKSRGNTKLVVGEVVTTGTETGFCGIGAYSPYTSVGKMLAGYVVQFRSKKDYVPSSVSLSTRSTYGTYEYTADITEDGFWFYIKNDNTSTNYKYWRGNYTV
ncbi:collagen-like protein [Halobacillus kuroshimensis]|uniref:Collagen-like protein n=2 Tax=Halobacillus kuroshimensis TaxID=302481 RepID=A0ABS3DZQ6_9BACI|nr:collagen-like protein [Halobacillus kuroshimensis]